VVTEAKATTRFLGNGELITGDHLDFDTKGEGIIDGLLGVCAGRIEDGKESNEFKPVTLSVVVVALEFLISNGKGTETTEANSSTSASRRFSISSVLLRVQSSMMIPVMPLVTRFSLPDASSRYVISVRLSTGLKGLKSSSLMPARARVVSPRAPTTEASMAS